MAAPQLHHYGCLKLIFLSFWTVLNVSYYVDVLCTYAIGTTVSLCSMICDVLIFETLE